MNKLQNHTSYVFPLILFWFVLTCAQFEDVNTKLHYETDGYIGPRVTYSRFMWQFTEEERVWNRIDEVKGKWGIAVRNVSKDSLDLILDFLIFREDSSLLFRHSYSHKRTGSWDTLVTNDYIIPHAERVLEGIFWMPKDSAKKAEYAKIVLATDPMFIPVDSALWMPDSLLRPDSTGNDQDSTTFDMPDTAPQTNQDKQTPSEVAGILECLFRTNWRIS